MRSFSKIGLSFIAGSALAFLGSTGVVRAQEGDPAAAARANSLQIEANAARDRATELAKQGGPAYKSGAMDRANGDATRLQAQADDARAEATGANVASEAVSPEVADLQARLESEKAAGGWAYKTGTVGRTEAEIRALEEPATVTTTSAETETPPPANWGKPVEQTARPEP